VTLACAVRDCARPLARGDRTWSCSAGHVYDIAQSGYVNLLQPQDRKSASAGDSKGSVDARARLLARGVGRALVDDVVRRAAALAGADQSGRQVVVDLGCGSGETLGALSAMCPVEAIGIDLSAAAVDRAARRFPSPTWVAANADRRLPLLDHCAAIVLSVNGRRNPAECARVLKPGGCLLVAIPAPDDLVELRERVQGAGVERDRSEGLLREHAPFFALRERGVVRGRLRLDRDDLNDLLLGTYRGQRHSASAQAATLDALDVTLASDLFVLTSGRGAR